jgi:hypothetical protein
MLGLIVVFFCEILSVVIAIVIMLGFIVLNTNFISFVGEHDILLEIT